MASRAALRKAQQQAQLNAFIATNPEASALAAAIRGERSSFISTARAAKGAALGIQALTKASRPGVAKVYQDAQDTRASAQTVLNSHLDALGPVAADYAAGAARENAGFRTRIGEARARTLSDLDARSGNALAGAAYAETAARSRYLTNKSALQVRQRELGREAGAITLRETNTALAQNSKDAQARRVERRQMRALDETSRHNQATEATAQQNADTSSAKADAKTRKDRAAAKRKGQFTNEQKAGGQSYVAYARQYARDAHKIGYNRHEVAQLLLKGAPLKGQRTDPKTKKAKEYEVAPSRQTPGERWTSVALDLAYDGHVSRANRAWLRSKGVSAARAGWPVGSPAQARRSAGQSIAGAVGRIGTPIGR